jgi:hypothetical protein
MTCKLEPESSAKKEHQFNLHLILAWTIHINMCARVAHGASHFNALSPFFFKGFFSDKQKCWPIPPYHMMIQIVYLHLQQIWIFCQIYLYIYIYNLIKFFFLVNSQKRTYNFKKCIITQIFPLGYDLIF